MKFCLSVVWCFVFIWLPKGWSRSFFQRQFRIRAASLQRLHLLGVRTRTSTRTRASGSAWCLVAACGRLVEDVSYYFSLINRLSAECRWLPLPQYVIPLQCDSDTCHWKNVNMKCIYVCRIVKLNTRTRMCSSRPPPIPPRAESCTTNCSQGRDSVEIICMSCSNVK